MRMTVPRDALFFLRPLSWPYESRLAAFNQGRLPEQVVEGGADTNVGVGPHLTPALPSLGGSGEGEGADAGLARIGPADFQQFVRRDSPFAE